MQTTLQILLDQSAIDWGLPKRAFSVRSVQEPYSAAVIQASQFELVADRQARERVARVWETRVHAAASRVWEAAGMGAISPDVSILYTNTPLPSTAYESLAQARWELEAGLIPRSAALRTLHPWLTDVEIARLLEEADEEADERAARAAEAGGHNGESDASGSGESDGGASGATDSESDSRPDGEDPGTRGGERTDGGEEGDDGN
jgi:hypothetical protein